MKKFMMAIILAGLGSQCAFADDTGATDSSPAMQTLQNRMQNYQSLTPAQQQAAQSAAMTQAQSLAQQKQQEWNSMTPAQQQAEKEQLQSRMQTVRSVMQPGMGSNAGTVAWAAWPAWVASDGNPVGVAITT